MDIFWGVKQTPKKLTNGGARFSVNLDFLLLLSHCAIEWVLGVAWFLFFLSNIDQETCTTKMGAFFIPFVMFTSTLVYSVVWNQSLIQCITF